MWAQVYSLCNYRVVWVEKKNKQKNWLLYKHQSLLNLVVISPILADKQMMKVGNINISASDLKGVVFHMSYRFKCELEMLESFDFLFHVIYSNIFLVGVQKQNNCH